MGNECWVLSSQGQSCSELCGSEAATDLRRWNAAAPEYRFQVVQALSHSALPPAALNHHAASNVLHIDEACGRHGYGSQYLYIAQGYQWDCYREQSFYQVELIELVGLVEAYDSLLTTHYSLLTSSLAHCSPLTTYDSLLLPDRRSLPRAVPLQV